MRCCFSQICSATLNAAVQDLTKLIENSLRVDVGGRRRHYLVVAKEGSGVDWLIDFEELDKLTKPSN